MLISFAACGSGSVGNIVNEIPVVGNLVREKIDLGSCLTTNFSGFNGAGTGVINKDYDKIDSFCTVEEIAEYVKKEIPTFAAEYYVYGDYLVLSDFFDFEFAQENTENLSNGSEVMVVVKLDEMFSEQGLTLEGVKSGLGIDFDESFSFTVSGLVEGIAVDLLSDLAQYVTYSGANGFGMAELEIPDSYSKESNGFYIVADTGRLKVIYNNERVLLFTPEIKGENLHNLKAGDTIKLSVKGYESYLADYNAFFKESEVTVTVPDLGSYVTAPEQITSEQLKQMETEVYNKCTENAFGSDKYEMIATYCGTVNPTVVFSEKSKFVFFFIVKESVQDFWNGGYDVTYEMYPVYNAQLKPDGTFCYEVGRYCYERFTTEEDMVNFVNANSDYTFSKIG